ncbi:MAG: HAD hydrolase-like protein [Eubacteriales bacterium]
MIGDRHFDIDGAKLFGMDSIGVLFGYGTREELEKSGATYIADNADEIRKILL